ncbi:MAG TPA: hemolysin family protein [Opitutaceae bacterium]|nr:hemolysin family protein [Opitutaceae bacterium]
MSTLVFSALEFVFVLGLIAANGFFVAAEFALVKVRTSQLEPLAKHGGWRVRLALEATRHLDAALSATQLGITLASLGLGWVGEPFVAHRIAPLLARFGLTEPAAVTSISFGAAFGAITFFHIVLGELAPKSLAIQRPRAVSLNVAGPLLVFYRAFYPFIWLLNGTANLFLRWAGLEPATRGEHEFSPDELEHVFTHARHSHPGDALINRLMVRSLRLRSTTAQQVMRPREQIVALWIDRPTAENIRIAQTAGFSRFPVCGGSLDDVRGVVLVREWLWQAQALGPETPFAPLLRPMLTFPPPTPVHAMIEHFRTSRTHLAVVLDEAERTIGLVSFEDVLEEIVGDIRDELDLGAGPVFEQSDSAIVVSGRFTMRELQAETGWNLEWERRETVAEWAERQRGRPLKRAETVPIGEYRVTAVECNADRLRRVRIERMAADPGPAGTAT